MALIRAYLADFMPLGKVAYALDMHPNTIHDLIKKGVLVAHKKTANGKTILSRREVLRWLASEER